MKSVSVALAISANISLYVWALANNFISIVAVSIDYSSFLINDLKYLEYDL